MVYVSDEGEPAIETYAEIDAPRVEGMDATNVGQATATLNGRVNPRGNAVTDCEFDYATNAAFDGATTVACEALPGDGSSPVHVSADISGLAPGTKYHVRLRAANGGGESVAKGKFKTKKH